MAEVSPSRRHTPDIDSRRIGTGVSFDRDVFALIEERRGLEPRSSFLNRLLRRALELSPEETPRDAAA